ncbi:MAG: flagellar basal body rod protein FlgB [Tissierellia bacterium]|nr:flagellar basal body rod protein FlgB [Tissierellia bacterium]
MDKIMKSVNILNYALDGLWLRNKAINHNIANVDTPNYKRITVNFENALKKAIENKGLKLNTTHEKHISNSTNLDNIEPDIKEEKGYSYRNDGNNVNIDVESANLAKNAIMYNGIVNQIMGEFNKLKSIINEGR